MQAILDETIYTVENDLPLLIDDEEDMKLRDEDKKWFRDEIAEATTNAIHAAADSFRPHGLRRVAHFLGEWGLAGTIVTVFVALLALAASQFYYANQRVKDEATFEATTKTTLDQINVHLTKIDASLAAQQIQQLAENPADKGSALEARQTIDADRKASIVLPSEVVQRVGRKFVDVSAQNPAAWGTTLSLLDYKSFVDSSSPSIPLQEGAKGVYTTHFFWRNPEGSDPVHMYFKGRSPKESAAQFMLIGHDPDEGATEGVSVLFAVGGGQILDGMQLRNVVFNNVRIVYNGGPLRMTNVYFINCTFEMQVVKNTQDLAIALLAPSPSTTFSGE
jgi:hypothetical protein